MAFGQQTGPPAPHRRLQHLTELVRAAGHTDLRDARGPLGLTQRQAGGRFTAVEAEELIARLEAEAESAEILTEVAGPTGREAVPAVEPRAARRTAALGSVPDEVLAAELQRRGWVVLEP